MKAIQTYYKGYHFRSRNEARWAVFFEHLGLEWEYEREGWDLVDVGYYLPDFYLRMQNCWVEIKPRGEAGYQPRCKALADYLKSPVLVICGSPWPNEYEVTYYQIIRGKVQVNLEPTFYFATGRQEPRELWLTSTFGDFHCLNPIVPHFSIPLEDSTMLLKAYELARGARFEHSEKPPIRKKVNDESNRVDSVAVT